jgi:hypothetical protein
MKTVRRAYVVPVTLVLLAGCSDDAAPYVPPPADLTIAGKYELTTEIDLTASSLVPDPVHTYLDILARLRDDPAGALFAVLDEAGVPLASDLEAALPDIVDDRLEGWINDYVLAARYQGTPVRDEIAAVVDAASTVLTRFELASSLDVPAPDAQGWAETTHRLQELRYTLYDGSLRLSVPLDPKALDPAAADLALVVERRPMARASAGQAGSDAHLAVEDHTFGVPYGAYAYVVLDEALRDRYGVGIRGALGALLDCPALGAAVGGRCVLGLCVGHAADLTAICEQGLDLVAEQVRDRIQDLSFDALYLQHGDAALWDAPAPGGSRDGRVDRLDGGVWKASIDLGGGAHDVPARFTGTRSP